MSKGVGGLTIVVGVVAAAAFASSMASKERDDKIRKDLETLQATVATLESNTASNMTVMANVDTALIRNMRQLQENDAKLQETDARLGLQNALYARALIEEMGQKNYDKEVKKFLDDLESAKKAQAEAAAKAAQAQPEK